MTFIYKTYCSTTNSFENSGVPEETRKLWEHIAEKKNWRIVQLPNGFYQAEYIDLDGDWVDVTRRETIESTEKCIDGSIEHYKKKLDFLQGPKVVKTFE